MNKSYNEETLTFIKPHVMTNSQEIVNNLKDKLIENKGIFLIAIDKIIIPTRNQIKRHYIHLEDKDFYNDLVNTIAENEIRVLVLVGKNIVQKVRKVIGATDPKKAEKGTIRYIYGDHNNIQKNAIHASDSSINAKSEIYNLLGEDYYNNLNILPSIEKNLSLNF